MPQFIAFFKTIWEVLKVIKEIKSYFDKIYVQKLEAEQNKKAEVNKTTTESIQNDVSKPVEEQSDETLIAAHTERTEPKA